jgi:D-sedoheptulose 7-phosphate isomerase
MIEFPETRAAGAIRTYLGVEPGGECFLDCLKQLDLEPITHIGAVLRASERVFLMGNGGSFANARLMANLLKNCGIQAQALGSTESCWDQSMESGYETAFHRALVEARLTRRDAVIALSGSGNSPNILAALRQARDAGAVPLALGGGSGGAMVDFVGTRHAVVVPSTTMETIEDLHVAVAGLTARTLGGRGSAGCSELIEAVGAIGLSFSSGLARLAHAVVRTLSSKGSVLILGLTPGAAHWRLDLERGSTNRIPIRGIRAPALVGTASMTASCNDDGFALMYLKALTKLDPGPDDVAILIGKASPLDEAKSYLAECNCPTFGLGFDGADADIPVPADQRLFDLCLSLANHSISHSVNQFLAQQLDVQSVQLPVALDGFQRRRPTRAAVLALEAELKASGRLKADRVLTFAYGHAYSARHPAELGLERSFY